MYFMCLESDINIHILQLLQEFILHNTTNINLQQLNDLYI